ncbi:hypothetical protein [Deinococcus petrolearius]|uniref:DUF4025 domain-containing protein n=1 Tax=Deinococcus petrolearius TaxID=1751295 RepID=A0ABW1DHH0_9DEIO
MTQNTQPDAAPMTETGENVTPDHAVYQPPNDAQARDELDASVDGTSAVHYGANDPALYEKQPDQTTES